MLGVLMDSGASWVGSVLCHGHSHFPVVQLQALPWCLNPSWQNGGRQENPAQPS